jgi:hypothetical protein
MITSKPEGSGCRSFKWKLCSPFLLTGAIAVAALLLRAAPARAETCAQDEAGFNLQCTANDVSIASVTNARDPITGKPVACTPGVNFNFLADFT